MGLHHHHHDHCDHGTLSALDSITTAFIVSILLNLTYVGVGFFYGARAQSIALLADVWHNFGDVLSLCLAWAGLWLARRRPSLNKTYGFGRASILAAFTNALLLFGGVVSIIYGALQHLWQQQPVETKTVMFVALAGVFINGGSAIFFMKDRAKDLNLQGAFLHLAFDAALSIGVVISAFIIGKTGWLWLDPALGFIIALVMLKSSWKMMKETTHLLLDGVPSHIQANNIREFLKGLEGVQAVHDLHIWSLSTSSVALSAHIVRPHPDTDDAWLDQIGHTLKERYGIEHTTLQIEKGNAAPCRLAPDDVI